MQKRAHFELRRVAASTKSDERISGELYSDSLCTPNVLNIKVASTPTGATKTTTSTMAPPPQDRH